MSSRTATTAALLLMALPCITFLYFAFHFCINVPYYDDFSVILKPIRRALSIDKTWTFRQYMLARSQGHVPLITHIIAWLEVKHLGAINFRWSTIAGDLGAIASVVVLVLYTRKKYGFAWPELIPLPFLLLSIVHWENMDFMIPAWQFYWGACLFPILYFIAVIEQRYVLASLAFACALFLSSGALCLYPLALLFYAVKKQWKNALGLGFFSGLCLFYFFSILTPEMVPRKIPEPGFFLHYVFAFMGNIVSNGHYELQSLAWLHKTLGALVIAMGVYGFLRIKGGDFFRFLFVYVAALAFMAIYARGDSSSYMPPRYALFALMGVIAAAYLFSFRFPAGNAFLSRKRYFMLMSVLSAAVWVASLVMCLPLLEQNRRLKNDAMLGYQATGDKSALSALMWDPDFGEELLQDARELGVYDFTKYKN